MVLDYVQTVPTAVEVVAFAGHELSLGLTILSLESGAGESIPDVK